MKQLNQTASGFHGDLLPSECTVDSTETLFKHRDTNTCSCSDNDHNTGNNTRDTNRSIYFGSYWPTEAVGWAFLRPYSSLIGCQPFDDRKIIFGMLFSQPYVMMMKMMMKKCR